MPGVVKRRARNSSGGQQQLISQVVSLPASKRSRKSTVLDSDQENVLADHSLLVECLTNAGMVVKMEEEQNNRRNSTKTSPPHLTIPSSRR